MADKDTKTDPDLEDPTNENRAGILGETIKKVFTVGMGAAFLTEESIRTYLGEIKLPKEMMNTILSSASKTKEDIAAKVGKELSQLISKVDIVKETARFLETHKMKISAEIEFTKRDKPE
jgi:hypothetical protein